MPRPRTPEPGRRRLLGPTDRCAAPARPGRIRVGCLQDVVLLVMYSADFFAIAHVYLILFCFCLSFVVIFFWYSIFVS